MYVNLCSCSRVDMMCLYFDVYLYFADMAMVKKENLNWTLDQMQNFCMKWRLKIFKRWGPEPSNIFLGYNITKFFKRAYQWQPA